MSGTASGLPWEASDDAPAHGVGICVSGGGLRAASFGLGVLQQLQEQRGLLFGAHAARYLSAVSGGSYIASAYSANAKTIADAAGGGAAAVPPFALGSPEELHVLSHGRYLVRPVAPTVVAFVGLLAANLAGLGVIVIWIGFMLGNVARSAIFGVSRVLPVTLESFRLANPALIALACLGTFASLVCLGRGVYSTNRAVAPVFSAVGIAGIALSAPFTYESLVAFPALRTVGGWSLWIVVTVGLMVASLFAALALSRRGVRGRAAAISVGAEVWSTRALWAVLVLCAGCLSFPTIAVWFDESANPPGSVSCERLVFLFAILVSPLVFNLVLQRSSIHWLYRQRIRECFGVLRDGSARAAAVPDSPPLFSELGDGRRGPNSYPQLLICATGNARNPIGPRGRPRYESFVFSHDVCGVPGTDAWFSTKQLELGRVASSWASRTEPALTLSTAVASAGAAGAPSMGRMSQPSLRPLLAALNVRLGWWLPNPFVPARRAEVAAMTRPAKFSGVKGGFGRGYDDLLSEMYGISGHSIYVTDGGHYDNLGLTALLRARCAEIWCVDASPDKRGNSSELRRVLALAADDGLIEGYSIDLDTFRTDVPRDDYATFAAGSVRYPNGSVAEIRIFKLGLMNPVPATAAQFRLYHCFFPFDPTALQWYTRERATAYRDLGRATAAQYFDSARAG
jgi:hypothetical protein